MGVFCHGTQAGPAMISDPAGLSARGRKQEREGRGHWAVAPADSGDPRWWGRSGSMARATQLGGGPIWGSGEEECSSVTPSATVLSGGRDLAVVGQRSSWWRRWKGRGGALYSRRGRCDGRGVRQWPKVALDEEVASAGEEEGGWLDALMIPYRGRRLRVVASLAWLRGAQGRCSVVSVRCLEQRSAVRGTAEWGGSLVAAEEEVGYGVSTWPLCGIRARHTRGGSGCMGCAWSGGGGWSIALVQGGGR
jgi:hypothetical protein